MTGSANRTNPKLVVALCTHNPRKDILAGTLLALKSQTLPPDQWHLLVVDNGSTNATLDDADLSWHPFMSRVRENQLGIAYARHRAIREASARHAELLLFVDDDTRLAPDFLERGSELGCNDSRLGCWGGQLLPDFETPPPPWLEPFAKYLAIFPLDTDMVSTRFSGNYDVLPPTAGLFLRVGLAKAYVEVASSDSLRMELGGRGLQRLGGEDMDFALFVLASGYSVGRFRALHLCHFMPASRVTLGYMENLIEGVRAGTVLLAHLWRMPMKRPGWLQKVRRQWQVIRLPEIHRRIFAAEIRGERRALALIRQHGCSSLE